MFVNSVFDDIVQVLSNGANAYVPTYHRNFFKFWWNEELAALKESSIESSIAWKAAGKLRAGPIFDRRQACRLTYLRRIKECERSSTEMYTNELHEALIHKSCND